MNKKVIIITNHYPFNSGEEFLDKEIRLLEAKGVSVDIYPLNDRGISERSFLKNITVKLDLLSVNKKFSEKLSLLVNVLMSPLFYVEIYKHFNGLKCIFVTFSSLFRYFYYRKKLEICLSEEVGEIVLYTYWYNEATYALQSLKNVYKFKLITRVHGGDLYEERRSFHYMPLRNQFRESIDRVCCVSIDAAKYMVERYRFNEDRVSVARLGVEDSGIKSIPTNMECLTIVSCSYVVAIKRLDLIVDTIVALSMKNPSLDIKWFHIGGGSLYSEIVDYANQCLSIIGNVSFCFVGKLTNKQVYEFYQNTNIDVFINMSDSEGVPVSMMEAMSCYIPVVGRDVGGVSEIIKHGSNGYLLKSSNVVEDAVSNLLRLDELKSESFREAAHDLCLENFSAEKNYSNFICMLLNDDL